MSQQIVEEVRKQYPTPLGAQHAAFLVDLCRALGSEYGLYRKSGGDGIRMPDGVFVSGDIVVTRDGLQWFDVLEDNENKAKPEWSAHTNATPSDSRTFYDVGAGPVPLPPTPPSQPPTIPLPPMGPIDLGPVLDAIKAMAAEAKDRDERIFANLTAQISAIGKPKFPSYDATVFGQHITLNPKG